MADDVDWSGPLVERRPLLRNRTVQLNRRMLRDQRRLACGAILISEMLERIAFLGLSFSLILFLKMEPLDWTAYNAISITLIFIGCSYVFCIVGGSVADILLGRLMTVCVFFVVYIAGYVIFPILAGQLVSESAHVPKMCSHDDRLPRPRVFPLVFNGTLPRVRSALSETCAWPVCLFICVLAIGAGFVKTNIAPFGAEHWQHDTQIRDDVVESFFDWFFWTANFGTLIFLGATVYVQQSIKFYYGYIIPIVLLSFGLLVFLSGTKWYTKRNTPATTRRAIQNVFGVLKYSCCRGSECCRPGSSTRVPLGDVTLSLPKNRYDYARIRYGGEYNDQEVDEAVAFLRLVVIMLAFIPYWTVYHQMPTSFVFQGLHMRLQPSSKPPSQLTSTDFTLPVAWLYMFHSVVMIILIPFMDSVVYPRLPGRGRSAQGLRNRIAIGFFISSLSMVAAGILEYERLEKLWGDVHPGDPPSSYNQTIRLELAYSQAPKSMKGIAMSIYWFYAGIGGFFAAILAQAFTGVWFFTWDYGNINCRVYCNNESSEICYACHLDYYFFFLAGFAMFGLLLFLLLSVKVGIKGPDDGTEDGE